MSNKLEVSINVIVHATEDISKFMSSFEEFFCLKQDMFSIQSLLGHYDNPITVINVKLSKNKAKEFLDKIIRMFSKNQIQEIFEDLESRIDNSSLHIRLNKQEFIYGKIGFRDKDAIKIKISTPIYNKKDKVQIFKEMLQTCN